MAEQRWQLKVDATGRRMQRFPMLPARVLEVLGTG